MPTDEYVKILLGYACDDNPRVSKNRMRRAIIDIESRYGVDSEDFTTAMENEAIEMAVEEQDAIDEDFLPEQLDLGRAVLASK